MHFVTHVNISMLCLYLTHFYLVCLDAWCDVTMFGKSLLSLLLKFVCCNHICLVQGNYRSGGVYWIILMITFWILYSYLVPISLFVSLEIVKFWQGFLYINHDREMKVCILPCFNHMLNCMLLVSLLLMTPS